jgi:hypothetical protein
MQIRCLFMTHKRYKGYRTSTPSSPVGSNHHRKTLDYPWNRVLVSPFSSSVGRENGRVPQKRSKRRLPLLTVEKLAIGTEF